MFCFCFLLRCYALIRGIWKEQKTGKVTRLLTPLERMIVNAIEKLDEVKKDEIEECLLYPGAQKLKAIVNEKMEEWKGDTT